jgi:hypothetical protein
MALSVAKNHATTTIPLMVMAAHPYVRLKMDGSAAASPVARLTFKPPQQRGALLFAPSVAMGKSCALKSVMMATSTMETAANVSTELTSTLRWLALLSVQAFLR